MIAQRVGVAALRRGVAIPGVFSAQRAPGRALAAAAVSASQARAVATTKVPREQGDQILARQRLNRPVSPHLGIYKLEQTWFGASAWTRITGVALSGTAYLYFASYLVAPLLGLHLESASLAAAFAGLPLFAKGAIKFAIGFHFTFHLINGIKHLIYDVGIGFDKMVIKQGELMLWFCSIVGGLYLAVGI